MSRKKQSSLYDTPLGVRDDWAERVGYPHQMGVALDIGISDEKGEGIEYQMRGGVDVPSAPFGDDERKLLVNVLFHAADIPQKEKRKVRLLNWIIMEGGEGLRIDKCSTIPRLTDADIIGALKVFTAPDVEEIDEGERIGLEKHNEWFDEYEANSYCRYESRKELNQRFQDILVNTQVLKLSGKLGWTTDQIWYRLSHHVIIEMLARGEPPTESNLDPSVQKARPFFDGGLCRKAANVVSARGTRNDVVVKYGKRQYMEDLYRKGLIYMNVASEYDMSKHNQAIRDNERSIVLKGGYSPTEHPKDFYNIETIPGNIKELVDRGRAKFSTIYKCPDLKRDQCVSSCITMLTDYWMFCLSDVLDPRLFADFEADSCVIIRREPFIRRLSRIVRVLFPNTNIGFGNVNYVDPLGAIPSNGEMRVDSAAIPIHMTKVFRYAYQREMRFVSVPRKFQEHLMPQILQIGLISDIADFVVL